MQEMFFRHLYATVQPTLQQRCESWDNYCALFNIILGSSINMQVCQHLLSLKHLCHEALLPTLKEAWWMRVA